MCTLFELSCYINGILVRSFCFLAPKDLKKMLAFKYFGFERTRWRLFPNRVVRTEFDIYVFILMLIILTVYLLALQVIIIRFKQAFYKSIENLFLDSLMRRQIIKLITILCELACLTKQHTLSNRHNLIVSLPFVLNAWNQKWKFKPCNFSDWTTRSSRFKLTNTFSFILHC
jgi:hypothetical protein